MRYGNGGHKAGGGRLNKFEEMQWSTVRRKDASETEGEGLPNSDQASNAVSVSSDGNTCRLYFQHFLHLSGF